MDRAESWALATLSINKVQYQEVTVITHQLLHLLHGLEDGGSTTGLQILQDNDVVLLHVLEIILINLDNLILIIIVVLTKNNMKKLILIIIIKRNNRLFWSLSDQEKEEEEWMNEYWTHYFCDCWDAFSLTNCVRFRFKVNPLILSCWSLVSTQKELW